jgi:ribosomal protein S18 acetylase RimI-like enzyme
MADPCVVRRLAAEDLAAYKLLRDTVLAESPTAFTSDAAEELRKTPMSYLPRLGLDRAEGGQFTLGAWHRTQLVGAITCERDHRLKRRHIGDVVGMIVLGHLRGQGIGRQLLAACVAHVRSTPGMELLTLSVTSSNVAAIGLYQSVGFTRYGTLVHAIKLGGQYHDKDLMALNL